MESGDGSLGFQKLDGTLVFSLEFWAAVGGCLFKGTLDLFSTTFMEVPWGHLLGTVPGGIKFGNYWACPGKGRGLKGNPKLGVVTPSPRGGCP